MDMLQTLRTLDRCGTEVYFEQENIWLSRRHIQVLLTAYCALAQAESEDMSKSIKWGVKRGFQMPIVNRELFAKANRMDKSGL